MFKKVLICWAYNLKWYAYYYYRAKVTVVPCALSGFPRQSFKLFQIMKYALLKNVREPWPKSGELHETQVDNSSILNHFSPFRAKLLTHTRSIAWRMSACELVLYSRCVVRLMLNYAELPTSRRNCVHSVAIGHLVCRHSHALLIRGINNQIGRRIK